MADGLYLCFVLGNVRGDRPVKVKTHFLLSQGDILPSAGICLL